MPGPKQSRMLAKAKPAKISDALKREVTEKANILIETRIRPEHVQPPPEDPRFSYIEDILTKWHGRYFYLIAKYICPAPDCIKPSFEVGFARLTHVGPGYFELAYPSVPSNRAVNRRL